MKKPYLVYALAIAFILAPLGNFLLSVWALNAVGSWTSERLLQYLGYVPFLDWFWFALVFLSGIALLRPHKLTWGFAMVTLACVLLIHVYKALYVRHDTSLFQDLHFYSALLSTGAVFAIGYHFRFPYLSRRANWYQETPRVVRRVKAFVEHGNQSFPVWIQDASATGVFIVWESEKVPDWGTFEAQINLRLEEGEMALLLAMKIVRVETSGAGARILKFLEGQPREWRDFLKKLRQEARA